MANINNLTSTQNFKDWFNKTNEIIDWANIQNGIGVTGISAGAGISLGFGSGKNIISLKDTIPGVTISGNMIVQGNATINGSLSVSSLSVNTTTISYTPKLSGLTSGNVVSILEVGGLTLAKANNAENSEVFGVVVGEDANSTLVAVSGKVDNSSFSKTIANALGIVGGTLSPGIAYFLSPTVAGGITSIEPTIYGQVSKPILLGITGDTGVILPYRGYIIEGISAGITAELDNKIILSIDYTTPSGSGKSGVIKPGDPVYYIGESPASSDVATVLSDVGLGSGDLKLSGGTNTNTIRNAFILNKASSLSLRNYCIGVVSQVLSDDSVSVVLEIVTRGGSFILDLDDLDSNIYDNSIVGGIYKFNDSTKFVSQGTIIPTNTCWATIIKNNDAQNTGVFTLNHTEYLTSSGTSSLVGGPITTIIYEGITAGITFTYSNNLLTNGSFRVWQRGNISYSGATLASLGTYFTPICDRWFVNTHGCTSMSLTFNRNDFTSKQTDVLGSPVFYINYANTYQTKTAGNLAQRPKLQNVIKGARYLNGQTGTFAFYAKAGISGATLDVVYARYNDSYTSISGLTTAIESRILCNTSGITLTADWKEYSVTFKLNSGITLTNTEEGWFGIGFEFPNTTTYSLAQTRFNLGNSAVQPTYTEFDKELQECKRYYQSSYTYGNLAQTISDYNMNEATIDANNLTALTEYSVRFPIKMIGAPNVIQIFSTDSGVSGEAYNVSASQDLRNTNGTLIKVPWTLASPYRSNAKLTNNIYINSKTPDAFTIVLDGGAYSTDRIKFHWIANADFDKVII